jgi:hypothetical protein
MMPFGWRDVKMFNFAHFFTKSPAYPKFSNEKDVIIRSLNLTAQASVQCMPSTSIQIQAITDLQRMNEPIPPEHRNLWDCMHHCK